jgi:hypothetical protein
MSMKVFTICSVVVVVMLAAIMFVAWRVAPHQRFLGVSEVCYGYLLGWFGAWWSNYYWLGRRTDHRGPLDATRTSS